MARRGTRPHSTPLAGLASRPMLRTPRQAKAPGPRECLLTSKTQAGIDPFLCSTNGYFFDGRVQRPKDRLICRCPRRLHSTPRLAAAIAHVSLTYILPCPSSLFFFACPPPSSGAQVRCPVGRASSCSSGAPSSSSLSRRLSHPTSFLGGGTGIETKEPCPRCPNRHPSPTLRLRPPARALGWLSIPAATRWPLIRGNA